MQNIEHRTQNARRQTLLVCVVLAIAVLAAYEGVRNNEFVNYDDTVYITENPQVQQGLRIETVAWALADSSTGYWHPLTWISHMIDCDVFGIRPGGHHLVSVGFHIANVLLLFLILRKATGAFWPSAFVSAVFGLHPLAAESVAWVAERKNVLSTFFGFLTILAYLRYAQKPGVQRYLLVAVLFAAGLFSKPMLVTLPFVLLLLDYWPLGRFNHQDKCAASLTGPGGFPGRLIFEKIPLFAMSLASCAATIAHTRAESMSGLDLVPMGARAGNTAVAYVGYIGRIFYPANLAVLYPVNLDGPALWKAAVCFLILVFVSAAALLMRRRFSFLFTGWFWFLGTLVPVIGLVQVGSQGMADRYMYVPGIGIYIVVAWLAGDLREKLKLPKPVLAIAGVAATAVLMMLTRQQVRYWKDSFSLCGRAIAVTKDNYIMHTNLGCALMDKGLNDEAAAEFEKALKITPNHGWANNGYGIILAQGGLYDKAIEQFRIALSGETYIPEALSNLCRTGVEGGRLDAVLEIINNLKRKTPDNAELYYNEGMIYRNLASVKQGLVRQEYNEKCIELLEKALELAEKQGRRELAEEIRPRLEKYRRENQGIQNAEHRMQKTER